MFEVVLSSSHSFFSHRYNRLVFIPYFNWLHSMLGKRNQGLSRYSQFYTFIYTIFYGVSTIKSSIKCTKYWFFYISKILNLFCFDDFVTEYLLRRSALQANKTWMNFSQKVSSNIQYTNFFSCYSMPHYDDALSNSFSTLDFFSALRCKCDLIATHNLIKWRFMCYYDVSIHLRTWIFI